MSDQESTIVSDAVKAGMGSTFRLEEWPFRDGFMRLIAFQVGSMTKFVGWISGDGATDLETLKNEIQRR